MFSVKIWTAYKSKGVGSLSAKQNRVKNCSCANYKFFTLSINDKRNEIYPVGMCTLFFLCNRYYNLNSTPASGISIS